MIVSAYTIELYCDHPDHPRDLRRDAPSRAGFEISVDGRDCYAKARSAARKAGWRLTRSNEAICPKCNKKSNEH